MPRLKHFSTAAITICVIELAAKISSDSNGDLAEDTDQGLDNLARLPFGGARQVVDGQDATKPLGEPGDLDFGAEYSAGGHGDRAFDWLW